MKRSNFGENPNSPADQTIAEKLWQEEIECPLKDIQVYIDDQTIPIVVLFGPPASGKTMTLIRLTRYLQQQGYLVRPDCLFRDDVVYHELCDDFRYMVNRNNGAPATCRLDVMSVDVLDKRGIASARYWMFRAKIVCHGTPRRIMELSHNICIKS